MDPNSLGAAHPRIVLQPRKLPRKKHRSRQEGPGLSLVPSPFESGRERGFCLTDQRPDGVEGLSVCLVLKRPETDLGEGYITADQRGGYNAGQAHFFFSLYRRPVWS